MIDGLLKEDMTNMKKVKKIIVSTFLMLALVFVSNAQSGWNWGDQVDVAKEKNVLYNDAQKAKNYAGSLEPLNWLLENTPDLNVAIYQNGIKIYEALAKAEQDPVKKEEYIQVALNLHDKRVEYFGKKEMVTDRKIFFAYYFYNKDKTKYEYLYDTFSEAFNLLGSEMNRGNLVAYMNVIYKHNFAGGNLSDEVIIESYTDISDALAEQKKNATDKATKDKTDKSIDQVDKLLTATKVEISCEFVEEKLGPKLDETGDPTMAKKIFSLLLKAKCLDSPYALKAAEIVQNGEPTYGIAKFMAQKNSAEGNEELAIKFFKEAADLTDDNNEKAEAFLSVARIQAKNGQKSTARSSARRALSFDPSTTDAYKLIGDLYMGSSEDCNQNLSRVDDRAIFIAAYDQYRKAGHSAGMTNAKAQFPSIADIFSEGKEEGQSITIGCWINTTVKLERRPAN